MKQHHPSPGMPDEGYFASFTDMLVGIIFIFIILLMIVANDYQSATESITKISADLDKARNEARDRERDAARDKERDQLRDSKRDAARDKERDEARDHARDTQRDAARDLALAEAYALKEAQAQEAVTAMAAAKASAEARAELAVEARMQAEAAAAAENIKTSEPKANDDTKKKLTGTQQNLFNDSRAKVLLKIQQTLNMQGFAVTADINKGILVIPENILFYANDGKVNHLGRQVLNALANSFTKYLPCISPTKDPDRLLGCNNLGFSPHDGLDVILIDDYPGSVGSREDKLLLAVHRVVSIFNELKTAQPYLDKGLKNKFGVPILDIKVNKERRSAKNQQHNTAVKEAVVLRFIMRHPNQADIKKFKGSRR